MLSVPPHLVRVAAMLALAATLGACASAPDAGAPAPDGSALFAANCAVCHGAGGEGQPEWHVRRADGSYPAPPLNGDGHTWHHGDGLLYRVVSEGGALFEAGNPAYRATMPAFGDRLSRDEIVAVLAHVKSLWAGKTSRGLSIVEAQAYASESDPFPPP